MLEWTAVLDLYVELRRIAEALDAAGVAYALAGGLAVSIYTTPRATEDIDLLIRREGVDRAVRAVEPLDFRLAGGAPAGGARPDRLRCGAAGIRGPSSARTRGASAARRGAPSPARCRPRASPRRACGCPGPARTPRAWLSRTPRARSREIGRASCRGRV